MDVKIDVSGEMDSAATNNKQKNTDWSNLQLKMPTLKQIFSQIRQNLRSWTEFLNMNNFKMLTGVQRLHGRLTRNLAYFQSNYVCVFIILMLYCLITSPFTLLLVIAGVLYACYKIRQTQNTVTIFGRKFNTSQQCMLVMLAASPLFYLVGVGAMVFWLLGTSLFLILLHASFYNIDAIVTEDTEMFITETV